MTGVPNEPDLVEIARETEAEITIVEAIEAESSPDDAGSALATVEFGYYEAALTSLRDAATTLNEAERSPG